MQHTVQNIVTLCGVGLHSGAETVLRIKPAVVSSGVVFVRVDVSGKNNVVPARWDRVVDTRLCTVVGNEDGVTVGTIEHLMAALAACGVDNAVIELDGPEVPIMDGSSEPFIDAILDAGLSVQTAARRAIKILKEVSVRDGDKIAVLTPGIGSRYSIEIDFSHPEIGRQSAEIDMFSGDFIGKIAEARTFGFLHEVNALRAMGLALGGSLDNAIVLDTDSVMNPEGLRCSNEFARHKVLDAVGDL
ncbi:MAG TPA: UDP-3-O-acyl-N-acetylglucosamine deacetylase, partial [Alphaproteobacteria bacterium]|nr:UDP-3-O-acyl-N-acetylglucosamine deacetylase [Alphaproteobacteria bacterium]